jgi:hypothetical protein
MIIRILCVFIVTTLAIACNTSNAESKLTNVLMIQATTGVNTYSWLSSYSTQNALVNRIAVPDGYKRIEVKSGSFAEWLRWLPLKEGKPPLKLYNGKLKGNQSVHEAIVNIDVGTTDIQQCADAVMRMRAEYLYSIKDYKNLHFNFTSGHSVGFEKWSQGYRTQIKGNSVTWVKSAEKNDSYKTFRSYCNTIFNYAGTSSLSKELKKVDDIKNMQIGDVFIVGGFPGHAVLVVDMCEHIKTKEKLFLIQQSYMPAQEIHVLKNFNSNALSPWYSIDFGNVLETPEWSFQKNQLMRW